jgi:PAS domain S-box-containing protein
MLNEISILHVDDEPDFADLAKTFLEREDDRFAVETATSADEGLQRISDRPPDCIVSDYNMPGMDGLEFLQAVRADHPDLPFILLTGKGSEEVASDAIAAGVTDYLQKSGNSEQYELLTNRIHNAVSARREAKRAEKQERFTTQALDALEDVFYVLNTDGSFRRWNSRFPEVTGYPESELAEMQATELFPEDERETVAEAIETTLTSGEVTVKADFLTADGERLPYEFTGARLTDKDGSTTGLVGVGRDLTDRRQQERRFQALVEESKDNISVIDADGVFQYQSPAVERILGYEPEETIGDAVWEYVHPDDRERLESTLEEWVATPGAAGPVEYRARHADGSWCWMEANGNNQLHNPAVEGYVVTSRDITDRKERERELERTHDLMRNMEQLADVGVWEYDAEQENLRITEGVRQFYQLDDNEELTLEQALDAVHPDDREALADRIHGCLETGQSYEIEVRLLPPDGEHEWVTVRGGPVTRGDSDGVVRGYVQDITEQREREQRLKRRNERLEEFTDIVSQDLRNPLGVVEGRLELAQETRESDHLDRASDALERSQALVDDLLTLAREGDQVDETESVGLGDIARDSWQNVARAQATLETDVSGAIPADRSRLRQMFENLYRNAVEHGGESVTIHVGETDGGFYVADTGPGIPESKRDDIFEAGYSTGEQGTGFGLRIVEQVADAHGWAIAVTESEQGGARFDISGVGTRRESSAPAMQQGN